MGVEVYASPGGGGGAFYFQEAALVFFVYGNRVHVRVLKNKSSYSGGPCFKSGNVSTSHKILGRTQPFGPISPMTQIYGLGGPAGLAPITGFFNSPPASEPLGYACPGRLSKPPPHKGFFLRGCFPHIPPTPAS